MCVVAGCRLLCVRDSESAFFKASQARKSYGSFNPSVEVCVREGWWVRAHTRMNTVATHARGFARTCLQRLPETLRRRSMGYRRKTWRIGACFVLLLCGARARCCGARCPSSHPSSLWALLLGAGTRSTSPVAQQSDNGERSDLAWSLHRGMIPPRPCWLRFPSFTALWHAGWKRVLLAAAICLFCLFSKNGTMRETRNSRHHHRQQPGHTKGTTGGWHGSSD